MYLLFDILVFTPFIISSLFNILYLHPSLIYLQSQSTDLERMFLQSAHLLLYLWNIIQVQLVSLVDFLSLFDVAKHPCR